MFDAPCKELVGYPLVRRLTGVVVVHTEIDRVDVRVVLQHLKQHLISHTAGGGIAVSAPVPLVQRNITEHIYGRLKKIEGVVGAGSVKAVTGIAALCIALVGALAACASLVRMAGDAIFIVADKDGVVVVGRFVDHSPMHKGVQHISVNPSAA